MIGTILNKIRMSKLISLRELSQKMKLGENGHIYLSQIECGRIIPTETDLKNILNALNEDDRSPELIEALKYAKADNSVKVIKYKEEKFFKVPKGEINSNGNGRII